MCLKVPTTLFGLALTAGVASLTFVSADDAKENDKPAAVVSSELVTPEFAEHLDVDAASIALVEEDDTALLEMAEKLSAAERKIGKPNPRLPASVIYQAAIRVAHSKPDAKSLAGAEAAVVASKTLNEQTKKELLSKIAAAKKVGAKTRKIDAGPGLKPNEVSAESVSLYNTFKGEIRTTQEYGTEVELEPLADGIKQLSEFHPKQREHLMKLVGEARSAIKERGEADPALAKLVAASRGAATSDFKIMGVSSAPEGMPFRMTVIPNSANGANAKKLELRGVRTPRQGPVYSSALLSLDPNKGPWSESLSLNRNGPPIAVYGKVSGQTRAPARFLAGTKSDSLNSSLIVLILPARR